MGTLGSQGGDSTSQEQSCVVLPAHPCLQNRGSVPAPASHCHRPKIPGSPWPCLPVLLLDTALYQPTAPSQLPRLCALPAWVLPLTVGAWQTGQGAQAAELGPAVAARRSRQKMESSCHTTLALLRTWGQWNQLHAPQLRQPLVPGLGGIEGPRQKLYFAYSWIIVTRQPYRKC